MHKIKIGRKLHQEKKYTNWSVICNKAYFWSPDIEKKK